MISNASRLISTILGPARGKRLPTILAVEIAAERIFRQHIAEDDLNLCGDVCRIVAARLNQSESSVIKSIARCTDRCLDQIIKQNLLEKYIGTPTCEIDTPKRMVICLATYAYFGKPYFQMIAEHSEYFTGQLSVMPSQAVRRKL